MRKARGRQRSSDRAIPSYAETQIWSGRYSLWKKYDVSKPKLPTSTDDPQNYETRWIAKLYSTGFNSIVGVHNNRAVEGLKKIAEDLMSNGNFPGVIIIYGPPGSGKSSLAYAFIRMMCDLLDFEPSKLRHWVLSGDAQREDRELWHRIRAFIQVKDAPNSRPGNATFKIAVVDNLDQVPSASQMELKKVMLEGTGTMKYVFICNNPGSLIGFIRSQAVYFKTAPIAESDALTVILMALSKMRVGYDRDGIQELFRINPELRMSNMINMLQKTFWKHHFISAENLRKSVEGTLEKPEIDSSAALRPHQRCSICTLYPPCKHLTIDLMSELGKKRRGELPYYRGGMECPEYMRLGFCSLFNKSGHCSLSHPRRAHKLKDPRKICRQCTISWPCNHCAYSQTRIKLSAMMYDIEHRVEMLMMLTSSSPPLAILAKLSENHDDVYVKLKALKTDVANQENMLKFDTVKQWFERTLTVDDNDYANRIKQLRFIFTDLLLSEILEQAVELRDHHAKERTMSQGGAGDEDGPSTDG